MAHTLKAVKRDPWQPETYAISSFIPTAYLHHRRSTRRYSAGRSRPLQDSRHTQCTGHPGGGGGVDSGPNADAPSEKGPILHLDGDNIDEALQRIERAGGSTLVGKTKISDAFGSFALFLDNVGNRLGLWRGE